MIVSMIDTNSSGAEHAAANSQGKTPPQWEMQRQRFRAYLRLKPALAARFSALSSSGPAPRTHRERLKEGQLVCGLLLGVGSQRAGASAVIATMMAWRSEIWHFRRRQVVAQHQDGH
jgi:hypothetical protein